MHGRFFGCVALGVKFGVYGEPVVREDGRLGAGEAGGGRDIAVRPHARPMGAIATADPMG